MQRILVIDDDADFQEATRTVLEKSGYEVVSAYDPQEGVGKTQSQSPDLVILDVVMPGAFEGFDVARKIREELNLKALPVIILSAVHELKKVPYRFAPHEEWLPVDYFLEKPVEYDVLVSKINEILNVGP